jgi:phosphatidylserine/phosphatidylglycerophosphate/cardiolipin synthase-like enzyme
MFNSKGSRAKELEKIFPLIRDNNPKTMHHKFFVVDSRYVVTGSMNPSSSGVNYNDEFLVIIDSEEIALQYREEFLSLIKIGS